MNTTTPAAPDLRPARGFTLLVVTICGVAMTTIALALILTAGTNRIISTKSAATDRSETIAESGMERAVPYAEQVARVERDFDLLLDPGLNINCSTSPATGQAPGMVTNAGIPRFTDALAGAPVVFQGQQYATVAFNGGAYLVRFDDDADDQVVNTRWASFTGNRSVNGCAEGPDVGGGSGTFSPKGHNPFRDRNRAVWITVVGIFPGTNPATAVHHTILRRYHVSNAPPPATAMHANGNLQFQNGSNTTICGNITDLSAGGNVTLAAASNNNNVCGQIVHQGTITGSLNTTPTSECVPEYPCSGFEAPRQGPVPPRVIPPPRLLIDRTTDCALLLDGTTIKRWDPDALGAGGACVTNVAEVTNNASACWQPIFGPVNPDFPNFRPGASFATCQVNWRPGTSTLAGCTACNGTNSVLRHDGTRWIIQGNVPAAWPAVVLVHPGPFVNGVSSEGFGALPISVTNPADWPLVTLAVEGLVDAPSGSGNFYIGYGRTADGLPISLASTANIELKGGPVRFGGGALTNGNFTVVNGYSFASVIADFNGPMLVQGDLTVEGGAKFKIAVTDDFFGAGQLAVSPTQTRVFR